MDALYAANRGLLFLIQGPDQVTLTGNAGSSYITNIPLAQLSTLKAEDPNTFFKQLLVKPYVSQVSTPLSPFTHYLHPT